MLAAEQAPRPDASELVLIPMGVRGVMGGTPVAPVLTKLYQESDLRPPVGVAGLHPATARSLGLAEKSQARFESRTGAVLAEVRLDPSLPLACVAMAAGPEPMALHPNPGRGGEGALTLCAPDDHGAWRETRVRVGKA
jgi:anaerobic selenocysteine-containing dehydrogenase